MEAPEVGDGEFASVICPLDVDYYKLSVTKTTFLSVLLFLARNDGVLAFDLLGPDMQVIQWSSGNLAIPAYPATAIEAVHAELPRADTYWLRVSHYSGDLIPYTFVVQEFPDETP